MFQFLTNIRSQLAGAEECTLAFHGGRPLVALVWVAQQARKGLVCSRADEEADHLAKVAAAYADRCEHLLGSSDRPPGGGGANSSGLGGRASDYASQADDGFALLKVLVSFVQYMFTKVVFCTTGCIVLIRFHRRAQPIQKTRPYDRHLS